MNNTAIFPWLPAWLTGWKRLLFCVLIGGAVALGHAPFSFPWLSVAALPALAFLAGQTSNAKTAFTIGWAAGTGYFLVALNWIVEPFLVEPEVFGWMAPFAVIIMTSGLALFWGMPFALARRMSKDRAMFLVLLAVFWSGSEYLRANIFTGFPWALISYIWIETPVIQWAAYLGPHGLGLLTLLVLFVPVLCANKPLARAVGFVVLAGLIWGGGQWRLAQAMEIQSQQIPNTAPLVRIVQPNAAQHLKWLVQYRDEFFNRQITLTSAGNGPRPKLIVWPETAVPFFLGDDPASLVKMATAAGENAQIITGIRRYEDRRFYNSLVQIDNLGHQVAVYDKHHLVPFGEYIPFGNLISRFGWRGLADTEGGGFSAGTGPVILDSPAGRYLPLICYEAIFPQYSMVSKDRPDFLLHLTNDGWFGRFSGPYQHLAQVRVRAIEQGLPVVRAANTGVSAVIDPFGQIVDALPLGEQGYLDTRLPAALTPTFYARYGNTAFLFLCAFSLLAVRFVFTPFQNSD